MVTLKIKLNMLLSLISKKFFFKQISFKEKIKYSEHHQNHIFMKLVINIINQEKCF
jgi:hypothetical protein